MLIWLGMTRLEAMISMIEDDMAQNSTELLCAISLVDTLKPTLKRLKL